MPSSQHVDIWLAGPGCLLGDGLLGLLLGPHEQDAVAPGNRVAYETQRHIKALVGLGKVNDVDPVALRENERAHLGIPAARLVAEVNAGLQELPH